MSSLVQFLGYGIIGLGAILAFFSYGLLSRQGIAERKLYVYMAFCLVLMAIGANIQVLESATRTELRFVSDENERSKKEISSLNSQISTLKVSLDTSILSLNAANGSLNTCTITMAGRDAQYTRVVTAMKNIVDILTPAVGKLQEVNGIVTSGVCGGDSNGKPYARSGETSQRVLSAVASINGAISTASQAK